MKNLISTINVYLLKAFMVYLGVRENFIVEYTECHNKIMK